MRTLSSRIMQWFTEVNPSLPRNQAKFALMAAARAALPAMAGAPINAILLAYLISIQP